MSLFNRQPWFPKPYLKTVNDETLMLIGPDIGPQIVVALKKSVSMIKRARKSGEFTPVEKKFISSACRQAALYSSRGLTNNPLNIGDETVRKIWRAWENITSDPELQL